MARAELSGRGTAPERALEAIKPSPRAPRESRSSPKLPCERRTDPAEHHKTAAERGRSGASIGSDQTLRRAQRESRSSPKLPCERRTDPAEHPQQPPHFPPAVRVKARMF